MLSYVQDALKRFHHVQPRRKQDQPHPYLKPAYGAKMQYVTDKDALPAVLAADKKFIQEVTGTFLYYNMARDAIMLPVLRTIATQQSKPTANTMKKVKHCLDYAATDPNAIIVYPL